MVKKEYFGKYRARVVDVSDPEERGRVKVQCPSVLGDGKSPWCEVCIPVAYEGGGDFCLPKVGDTVWVEFEGGDSDKPILSGGWWSKSKVPSAVLPYSNAKETRTIEFDGCLCTMNKDKMEFSLGSSLITVKKDSIVIQGGGATIRLEGGNIYLN